LLASAFQLASIPSSIFAAHGALHAPLELHQKQVTKENPLKKAIAGVHDDKAAGEKRKL